MFKKILSLALVALMAVGFASCGDKTSPDDEFAPTETSDFLQYELVRTNDDTYYISVTGTLKDAEEITTIAVPSEAEIALDAQEIAVLNSEGNIDYSFEGGTIRINRDVLLDTAAKIVVPVTDISILAFSELKSLTNVYLPDSITDIGGDAFSNCTSLKTITIPDNVQFISCSMFNGCSSLETVNLPQYIMAIEDSVFKGCDNLKTINYAGSEEDWNNLLIFEDGNEQMSKAKIVFNETDE